METQWEIKDLVSCEECIKNRGDQGSEPDCDSDNPVLDADCPRRDIPIPYPRSVYFLRMYRLCKITGHLPRAGGLLDQDPKLTDAFMIIDDFLAKKTDEERKRAEMEANRRTLR